MIGKIAHIGVTVSNIEKSIDFYRDKLGLKLESRMIMEGENTDILFGKKNMKAELAYLNGGTTIECPPVELICFTENPAEKVNADIHRTSISEICFYTENIEKEYQRLKSLGVEFLSTPQSFNLCGHKSKAVYFRDPDGIILELIESL